MNTHNKNMVQKIAIENTIYILCLQSICNKNAISPMYDYFFEPKATRTLETSTIKQCING